MQLGLYLKINKYKYIIIICVSYSNVTVLKNGWNGVFVKYIIILYSVLNTPALGI